MPQMESNKLKEKYSIAKDMKYEALYWALGYEEIKKICKTKTRWQLPSGFYCSS